MHDDIKKIFEDHKNNFYPDDDHFYEKIKCPELKPGQKVSWYYKDDLEYQKEFCDEFDIHDDPPFSGIVFTFPWIELPSNENTDLETEDCIILITEYQAEKEYCRSDWVYLHRLLDNPGFIELF